MNLKAIVTHKCPRCRKGDLFCSKNPYELGKVFVIHEHCEGCGLKFNREIGFFYGAMYVGYGLSVAYLTTFYVGMLLLLGDFEISSYFIFGIGSLFVLTPVIFRISRSIWLSMFVDYNPDTVLKWRKKLKMGDQKTHV